MSRVCGDDPWVYSSIKNIITFVPRMRGWSWILERMPYWIFICPAYAGMIPHEDQKQQDLGNLSRVCGDDPSKWACFGKQLWFVPRMRGWSSGKRGRGRDSKICPAYAGVIPQSVFMTRIRTNLSRVCGGDPDVMIVALLSVRFVPRMRGWSCWLGRILQSLWICPAYAGVILFPDQSAAGSKNLSRVCGDDPMF